MRLTHETALWCAIALMAALPRALGLDHALSNAEAAMALQSFNTVHGASVAFVNPLHGWLQTAVFAVLGDGNVEARLVSTLAGVVLCLMPILLRNRMSRTRALWMGALLALSPTLWFASQQAGGAMLAWTLAFAAFCGWGRRWWLDGVLAGVLLACGQDAVMPLVVLLVALLASGRLLQTTRNTFTKTVLVAGASFALAATCFLLRPQGLGDAFNGFAQWAQSLRAEATFPVGRLAAGFVLNDTLIFVAGLAGAIVLAVQRRFDRDEWGWAAWAGTGALLLILSQGRDAMMLVPVAMAGAAFAAAALDALVNVAMDKSGWTRFGVAGALAFMLCVYAGLGLRQYAGMGQSSWLLPIVIALLLMLAIAAGGSLMGDMAPVIRGVLAGVLGAVWLSTLGAGLQMTLIKPDNAAEAYRADAAERGLDGLNEMIRMMSMRATGEPNAMAVQVPADAPTALQWALRDQNKEAMAGQPAPAVLTREGAKPQSGNYIGQAYPIASTATLDGIGCKPQPQGGADCLSLARWITFRDAGAQRMENWVFWMRDDLAIKASGTR